MSKANQQILTSTGKILVGFLPFWLFITFFKFGAGLHYTLLSPLGEQFLPIWIVGAVISASALIQLIFDVPAGFLLDRYGYRRLLKVGSVLMILTAACLVFDFNVITYLLTVFMTAVGWLFYGPGINAYALSHAPKNFGGRFISAVEVFSSAGIVLSSIALPFIIHATPRFMGLFIIAILIFALLLLFFSPKDTQSVHQEKKIDTHHHYVRRRYISELLKAIKMLNPASGMLMLLATSSAIFYGVIWFTIPLVIAHQFNTGQLGFGLGIFDLTVVVIGFMIGTLADRFNQRSLVFFGLLIFSIFALAIGFNFGWLFIIFGFLATTGEEIAELSLWSWLHTLDKNHDRDGLISGVIGLFSDLGWTIGPLIAGITYGLLGPTWSIFIGAMPILLCWIIYLLFIFYHKPVPQILGIPKKPLRARHKR